MWTANIISATNINGTLSVVVQYTNDTPTFTETYNITSAPPPNWLKNIIINRLADLGNMDSYVNSLVLGKADTTPIPLPPPPTQAQIDFGNFSKWLQLTTALAAAKDMGWITGNETVVQNVKTQILNLATVNIPKLFS